MQLPLLTTDQMASFVARGFLRLDGVVPAEVNEQAMEELPALYRGWLDEFRGVTGEADEVQRQSGVVGATQGASSAVVVAHSHLPVAVRFL